MQSHFSVLVISWATGNLFRELLLTPISYRVFHQYFQYFTSYIKVHDAGWLFSGSKDLVLSFFMEVNRFFPEPLVKAAGFCNICFCPLCWEPDKHDLMSCLPYYAIFGSRCYYPAIISSCLCYHLKASTVVALALSFVLRTDLARPYFVFTWGFFYFFEGFCGNFDNL